MNRFLLLSLLPLLTEAFVAPKLTRLAPRKTGLAASSAEDEVAALRAAAAKAREEANRLAEELGKTVETVASPAAVAKKSLGKDEILDLLSNVAFEADGIESQSQELESLRSDGSLSLYKSANIRTYPVSLSMLESRTQLSIESFGFGENSGELVNMDDFKYSTLFVLGGSTVLGVASLALLPPNVGATACYACALVPIAYLAVGSTVPAAIAGVIDKVKYSDKDANGSSVERVLKHEAAHFLCGYLCGLPIADYTVLEEDNVPRVEFSVGKAKDYTNEEVACLSITAMSGLVAEVVEYGQALGAENDLLELQQIFRRSDDFIGAQQQQDLTRWGALQAFLLLKQNEDKFNQVVEAFREKKSVPECIAILES